jgi:hypothetical protein
MLPQRTYSVAVLHLLFGTMQCKLGKVDLSYSIELLAGQKKGSVYSAAAKKERCTADASRTPVAEAELSARQLSACVEAGVRQLAAGRRRHPKRRCPFATAA